MSSNHPVLVSSCLAGLCTRYDGRIVENEDCLKVLKGVRWIPVCPEQLGGLPTPRDPADIIGGNGFDVLNGRARVVSRNGTDVTEFFLKGAHQVLAIAQRQTISKALLKARSPSCGVGKTGVMAALLRQNNIELVEFE